MVTGDTGHNGLAAPKPVDQGQEAGQESVTTKLQLMEAETVRDQKLSLVFVTQIPVQLQVILDVLLLDMIYDTRMATSLFFDC